MVQEVDSRTSGMMQPECRNRSWELLGECVPVLLGGQKEEAEMGREFAPGAVITERCTGWLETAFIFSQARRPEGQTKM